jgi:hypothetical protein
MAIDTPLAPPEDMQGQGQEPIQVDVVPDGTEQVAPDKNPEEDKGFADRANLAEYLEEDDLATIASDLLPLFEADNTSRDDWMQTYMKGLDYLGFSMEDRTKPFKGASGVFHPILAESVVRFQSNAIIEIFPAMGPALTKILGEETPDKVHQAQRVKEELNYQLTDNMAEYRSETEQLLFRLPLAGSVFRKVYYDYMKKRPCAMMVVAEDFVVNYGASDLECAERYTHIVRKSPNEVKKMMRAGVYRQVKLPSPVTQYSEAKEKEDDLMGTERPSVEADQRHQLLEIYVHYNLPPPFNDPDGIADPYIITIDKSSNKVLSIYRNWDPKDNQDRNAESYFVHYQYMPGLGFYGVGLIHLLGSIAKASTSILRQLIDAGTLANLPGGLKTRGLRTPGEDSPIQPGEWRDIDVPAGAIRDNLFPLPYHEPSAALIQLLQMIIDEGRRIGSIADIQVGSMTENAPVGTTMALMERSLKVMSAVHARLHASLRKELKIISFVISNFMPKNYAWDESGQFDRSADFDGRVDILPVSDPNAATQAQKIVQLQAVQQLAQMNPELYNLKELHRKALQAIGIKDDEKILPVDQPPPPLDPVTENMHVLTGQPIKVYEEQDHTAHIQAHLSWATDPKITELVGQSPSAPKIQSAIEAHIAEHLAFQYRNEIQEMMGVPLPPPDKPLPPEVENALSRMVADAAVKLRKQHDDEAKAKVAEQMANDPVTAIKMGELELKRDQFEHTKQKDQIDLIMEIAKQAAKEEIDMRKIDSSESIAAAQVGANLVTFGAQLDQKTRESAMQLGKDVAKEIREEMLTHKELHMEADDRAAERQNKLDIARINASAKKKSSSD